LEIQTALNKMDFELEKENNGEYRARQEEPCRTEAHWLESAKGMGAPTD
jgi:hypothetical protein